MKTKLCATWMIAIAACNGDDGDTATADASADGSSSTSAAETTTGATTTAATDTSSSTTQSGDSTGNATGSSEGPGSTGANESSTSGATAEGGSDSGGPCCDPAGGFECQVETMCCADGTWDCPMDGGMPCEGLGMGEVCSDVDSGD